MQTLTPAPRSRSPILLPEYRLGRRPPNYGRTFPPEVLSPDEIRALMADCGRGRAGVRNRAIMAVMWRAGLRVAEVVALLPSDINAEHGIVHVRRGKGRRARRVGIDNDALAVVAEWVAIRDELELPLGTPLFCTYFADPGGPGRPLYTSYVRSMLGRARRNAKIERRVHPHAFRHSFAWDLMLEGIPLVTISRLLGHASTAYTDAYLSHLAPLDLVTVIREREPWLAAA